MLLTTTSSGGGESAVAAVGLGGGGGGGAGGVGGGLPAAADGEPLTVRYRIEEGVRVGTEVGELRKDVRLREKYAEGVLRLMKFRILSGAEGMFTVEELTSIIRVAKEIDRDGSSMCRQKEICEINLDVITQPVQYLQIIKVMLYL